LSPASQTVIQLESVPFTTSVNSSVDIHDVSYTLGDPTLASLNPEVDLIHPYGTTATGENIGSTTITSTVHDNGGGELCSATGNLTVIAPPAWWQVRDSDIQANNGLYSSVPFGNFFGLSGSGGYPGAAAYSVGTDLTSTKVSDLASAKWLANSPWSSPKTFDYAYFSNQIPDDITPTPLTPTPTAADLTTGGEFKYGYYWYKYDGLLNSNQSLTLPTINISNPDLDRKVILLVDNADLLLDGNITLTDGHGFFAVIVNGNIVVDPLVGGGTEPNLEGIYVADTEFQTGVGNLKLWVRGSVVGYSGLKGVNMQRDLGDAINGDESSELFEYAPDQILMFPSTLGVRKINWKEVAP
jgi:hypothetical protein